MVSGVLQRAQRGPTLMDNQCVMINVAKCAVHLTKRRISA